MMQNRRENARLQALRQLNLLDTGPSEAFDRITRIAAKMFDLPIAAVSLTDSNRQWFKSRVGVDVPSIPRDQAPCAEITESGQALMVPDLSADPRFRDSPLRHAGIRFYAGAPLITRQGYGLGSICVLGMEPRQLTQAELAILTDLAAMVMSQIELQHAFGRIDPASGLPNRSQFIEDLEDLTRDSPVQRRFAVLVDLANTEQLNSAIRAVGPSYVDDMINEAARTIQAAVGPAGQVYHVGATQFAFLSLPDMEERRYLALLSKTMGEIRGVAESRFVTTTALGVVAFTPGETAPLDLLRMGHSAAQQARLSETKVVLYSPAQDVLHNRRFRLLNEFGAALESPDQLSLVYQPRIDLVSGICAGAEALLRWNHPSLANIPPDEFIPLIEQTTMARGATAFVLENALKQLAAWRAAGFFHMQLSINVSPANLLEHDFAKRVRQGLQRHGVPPGNLELEVTEGLFLNNAEQALATLRDLTASGVRLAIDDFGTGYSSLSYLQRLPANVVKIDRSFVRDLAGDRSKQAIISAIVSLAHNFDYRVVAEGIETDEILNIIIGAKCQEAQGYLFSPPMRPDTFIIWARDWADRRPATVARARRPFRKSRNQIRDFAST